MMKKKKLVVLISLLCAIAQVNATMMKYNTSNQMVRVDKQSMSYGPQGYLATVDNINILHVGGGTIIEQQRSMVTTTFGGVRFLSNGVTQTIFTDNRSTLKTTSSDKNQRSYTDPYGNSIQKVVKESYPLENNRLTFDGGYQINKDLTNFKARNYILSLRVFGSMDSSNVANRYNFSDGNPIMKFDPSGHNPEEILNFIGSMTLGIDVGTILLDKDNEKVNKAVLTGLKYLSLTIFLGLLGKFLYDCDFFISSEDYLTSEIKKSQIKPKTTFTSKLIIDDSNLTENDLKNKLDGEGFNMYNPIGEGSYGTAYHNSKTGYVYKFYNNKSKTGLIKNPNETLAQRNARKMIQANKDTSFAKDIKAVGKNNDILRTPFVDDVINKLDDKYDSTVAVIDYRLHNNGMFMTDTYVKGNLGIFKGNPIVVDADQVLDSPYRETNSIYSKNHQSRQMFETEDRLNNAIKYFGDTNNEQSDLLFSNRLNILKDNFKRYSPEETKYYA